MLDGFQWLLSLGTVHHYHLSSEAVIKSHFQENSERKILGSLRIEPGPVGREPRTLPLCYAYPLTLLTSLDSFTYNLGILTNLCKFRLVKTCMFGWLVWLSPDKFFYTKGLLRLSILTDYCEDYISNVSIPCPTSKRLRGNSFKCNQVRKTSF